MQSYCGERMTFDVGEMRKYIQCDIMRQILFTTLDRPDAQILWNIHILDPVHILNYNKNNK